VLGLHTHRVLLLLLLLLLLYAHVLEKYASWILGRSLLHRGSTHM